MLSSLSDQTSIAFSDQRVDLEMDDFEGLKSQVPQMKALL
jgi:hypothetical protein